MLNLWLKQLFINKNKWEIEYLYQKLQKNKWRCTIKLGRPETPDNYEIIVPETHTEYLGADQIKEFTNVAHNIGLNNDQVKQLVDFQVKSIDAQAQKYQADIAVQKQQTEEALKKEWGHEYDLQVRNARRALQVYGDLEIQELMNGEAGNIPAVVKLLSLIHI